VIPPVRAVLHLLCELFPVVRDAIRTIIHADLHDCFDVPVECGTRSIDRQAVRVDYAVDFLMSARFPSIPGRSTERQAKQISLRRLTRPSLGVKLHTNCRPHQIADRTICLKTVLGWLALRHPR